MVCEIHEFVNQVGLPYIRYDAAKLLVRRERTLIAITTSQRFIIECDGTFFENFSLVVELDVTLLWRDAVERAHQRSEKFLLLNLIAHVVQDAHPSTREFLCEIVLITQQGSKRFLNVLKHR